MRSKPQTRAAPALGVLGCAVLALVCTGCGQTGRAAPYRPRLTASVARTLDARLCDQAGGPGLGGVSAAVVFPDGRVWSGAAGEAVLDPERAMTPQTALPFDSVTKVATAALALRLAERGRLDLNAPIRGLYRAWRGDPRATVSDLLHLTAGTRDPPQTFFTRLIRSPARTVSARRFLAASPAPGRRTRDAHYSNSGFVLGQIPRPVQAGAGGCASWGAARVSVASRRVIERKTTSARMQPRKM
jgi:D-alanyl-D-alanine carboxypeptidase